ncbi:hypothetical protein MNAN1_000979 [Malassezia nana]|uniref:HSF-type DNA-binding domain-containing protein n=1 Tax=Malassezia nana TaxID=180528 RepID=A0AAF0J1J9_9BASI|nr:hypothetical protein MNAN1_000979 [Malassezia nana]
MEPVPPLPRAVPSYRPVPMEKNDSLSPSELPTPPDDIHLAVTSSRPPMSGGAGWVAPPPPTERKSPLITPAYRAELPRYMPLSYTRLRPYPTGASSFQLSAERQGTAEPSEETDMSVDDVFAVSGHAEGRRLHTMDLAADVDDALPSSPAHGPQPDTDDSVPSLENSFVRSLPEGMARSPLLRRPSHRNVDASARTMTPAGPSRRAPYNVPSRSPISLGPLSHAYAMNMTPSSASNRSGRLASWSTYARPAVMMGPSMSAPLTSISSVYATYDDEETDDEVSAVDDDATDDEMDGGLPHYPRGVPMRRPLPHDPYRSMARSVPVRPYSAFSHSPDDVSRAQVHMAVAALDRLSMASSRLDDEKKVVRPLMDENNEVAAIRDRLGGAAHCSAFISKLWHLMINPDLYGKYIHWNEAGDAIIINSEPDVAAEFAAEVLPKLFKHGNNASFVRQLNLYGFQRVSSSRLLNAAEMHAMAVRSGHQTGTSEGLAGPSSHGATSYNTANELPGSPV